MLLTDEEIQKAIKDARDGFTENDKYKADDILDYIFTVVAKAQLKAVVEELQTEMLEDCPEGYSNVQCFHRRALQALLEEIKEYRNGEKQIH